MRLTDVRAIRVRRKQRRRVGRGQGSGWGTTAGRGTKGQHSRTGSKQRLRFEGGQMPIYRRLPKKGFSNARFSVDMHVVNVGALDRAFAAGQEVDLPALRAVGLAPKKARLVKLLGHGDLTKALRVRCHGASAGALEKVSKAGGEVEILPSETVYRPKGTPRPRGGGAEGTPRP
jgi:large subunit ribosomal protein L15